MSKNVNVTKRKSQVTPIKTTRTDKKKHLPSIETISQLVGSLKMNTALEYSTRVVQEGDRRCKKSTPNDLAYLTPLRIPLNSNEPSKCVP
jgi:hypothetical protein